MVKLLKDVQSHKNVCELMRSIFFFLFPKNLLGSCGNRSNVYRPMKLIVTTGFNVQLQAQNLIRKIDLKSVSRLSKNGEGKYLKNFPSGFATIL